MGSKPMPPLNLEIARKVAVTLFKAFYEHDPGAVLIYLELCFKHKRVEDRGQCYPVESPVTIRRSERDDAPSPVHGGFTIEAHGRWVVVRV